MTTFSFKSVPFENLHSSYFVYFIIKIDSILFLPICSKLFVLCAESPVLTLQIGNFKSLIPDTISSSQGLQNNKVSKFNRKYLETEKESQQLPSSTPAAPPSTAPSPPHCCHSVPFSEPSSTTTKAQNGFWSPPGCPMSIIF